MDWDVELLITKFANSERRSKSDRAQHPKTVKHESIGVEAPSSLSSTKTARTPENVTVGIGGHRDVSYTLPSLDGNSRRAKASCFLLSKYD